MDDQRFDNSIKNKVGDYEDTSFDPSALASLHHQLGAISSWPWYAQYRSELLVGSGIALSTLIILWSQWSINNNNTESLNEKIIAIQNQQDQIDKLQNEISGLKNTPPDTIRIIEIREKPSSDYMSLLYRIRLLEAEAANKTTRNEQTSKNTSDVMIEPPTEPTGMQVTNSHPDLNRNSLSSRLFPRTIEKESQHAVADSSTLLAQSNSKNLSAKTIRDLENHYQKGIGVRIGPVLDLGKGFYDKGDGEIGIGGGVLTDFILSPSLSVETGFKYAHRVYDISDENELATEQLPGMDPSLGTLKKIDIDSWVFEIPINLKYRYPISIKSHWLASMGYSSIVYGKQVFEYEYAMDSNPAVTINSGYESTQVKVYSGALNFSLGMSNQLKNKKILETSIYYQLGFDNTGIEKNSVNYIGLRGTYWFTVR